MNKFRLLCAAAAVVAAPTAVYAQETTSTIRGSISAEGVAVPNAQVVVTHVPTGTVQNFTTNEAGEFVAQGLRIGGPYTVTVSAADRQSFQATDVFLTAGEDYALPIDLVAAGTEGDLIVVTAQSIAGAGTQRFSPTTTLRRDDIEGVASVNRTVRDLVRRSPFATQDPTNTQPAISLAGQNVRFNRFSVDGVQFSDDFGINAGGLPTFRGPVPFDAICQFSVEIAPVSIREGDFQGGSINTQLCQGTNTPTGGAFYSYSDDSLTGDSIAGAPVTLNTRSEVYGVYLRGPIIPDRLFFAFAWERARNAAPTLYGPPGGGFANEPAISTALIGQVQGLTQSLYGYDPGGFAGSAPENDDKVTARVDWNINDNHRLALTYIFNDSLAFNEAFGSTSVSGNNTPRLNLFSNSYNLTERVHSGVVQLNSNWSEMVSTEARISYRDYNRGQTPPLGRDFGQFTVCLAPTSAGAVTSCPAGQGTLVFGPDPSRQANILNTENLDAQLVANVALGSHDVEFLAQYTDQDVYNLFLQNASGTFYFDSLADFQAGRAGSLTLQQSTSGDINQAAAVFSYTNFTFGIQDTWTISDTLTAVAGFRYELYDQDVVPQLNTFFTQRYGFTNQSTLNGRDIFLPRLGLRWRPNNRLNVSGTFGRYAGGSPDVYVSNSFSVTGVASSTVTFTRNTSAAGCDVPAGTPNAAAICSGALNGVFGAGPGIPLNVRNYVSGNTGALSLSSVNATDPDLRIGNIWRLAGSINYDANLGPLGDNWFFGIDAVYSWVDQAIDVIDLRSVSIGTAPDGRPRYGPFPGTSGGNQDLLLTNTQEGRSFVIVARFAKEFDSGFSIGASYTFQDVTERSPLTSSTAGSLYNSQATANPNGSTLGTANEEIPHSAKFNLGFRREFFEGAETRIDLFGEWRMGRPFSYTFDAQAASNTTRDPVFGVIANDNRHLIYVPTGAADPLVFYDSTATRDALNAFIDSTALADHRGRIAPKNLGRSDNYFRLDLHVSQEVPLPRRFGKIQVFADMENVLNFINDEWGVLRQVPFPYFGTLVDVACASATGGAPAAGTCPAYRYSNFRTPNQTTYTSPSLWGLRVGMRYSF